MENEVLSLKMAIQDKDFNIHFVFPVQAVFQGNNSTKYLEKNSLYIISTDKYGTTDR